MKVTSVEKKEKSTVELTIQVEADEFEAAVQKAYLKERKRINVPGFRKGHAPRKIIEGMYGSGVFYEDAINDVYPGAYEQEMCIRDRYSAFAKGGFYTLVKGFLRGMRMIFSGELLVWALALVLLCGLFLCCLLYTSRCV